MLLTRRGSFVDSIFEGAGLPEETGLTSASINLMRRRSDFAVRCVRAHINHAFQPPAMPDSGSGQRRADPAPVSAIIRFLPSFSPAAPGPTHYYLVGAGVWRSSRLRQDFGAAAMGSQFVRQNRAGRPADVVMAQGFKFPPEFSIRFND